MHRPRPHLRGPSPEVKERPWQTPAAQLNPPNPSVPQSEPKMREGGGTQGGGVQAAEEGPRRWGRGVGTWWCLGEEELGREPGAGRRENWRERAELGCRGPSPQQDRGGACYSASRSAGTRAAPVIPAVGTRLLPCPGLEPPPNQRGRRQLERLPHPGPSSPTTLPLPAGHLDPGPRTDRVPETLPAQLGGRTPRRPLCRAPRLPPTPGRPLPVPSLPPSPSLDRGRREGGVRPAPSPPPVIPPAWPARVGGTEGPGSHAGGAQGGSLCLSPYDPKSAGKMWLLHRPGGTW